MSLCAPGQVTASHQAQVKGWDHSSPGVSKLWPMVTADFIKLYWNTTTLVALYRHISIYGCLCTTVAELHLCD